MENIIIRNATLVTPLGFRGRKGDEMSQLSVVENAAVVATDGIISYCGPQSGLPDADYSSHVEIDACGNAVLPGFVDSHTHLIFGGYRPEEFGWRMKGNPI